MSPKKKKTNMSLRVGFISRLDFGSSGFRMGAIKLAARTLLEEKVHFNIIVGGLVSYKAFSEQIKKGKKELRELIRFTKDDDEKKALKEKLEKVEENFIEESARYLAKEFPRVKDLTDPSRSWVKWYIVTSPGYDGELGNQLAHRLAILRDDIVHWAHGYGIFSTRKEGRELAVLTPIKAPWLRGKYYSTPVARTILDWKNQHYSEVPHDLVIGCCGSLLQKPGDGEEPIPYTSLPVLCRLWDTRTGSENQVGVVVKEYTENDQILVRAYNYNDLIARQNDFIRLPGNINPQQAEAIKVLIKKREGQTVGQLAHSLSLNRKKMSLKADLEELRKILPTKTWPGLVFDDASGQYDFNPEWIQKELIFPYPKKKANEDSLVAFGCMHAGCVHTNYGYLVNNLPQIIVNRKASVLVGAGDFVEGLKHNLILRKEVFGGLNNTAQEKLAGIFVGEVMLRVFRIKMDKKLAKRRVWPNHKLEKAIEKSLIDFVYIYGNHCAWSQDLGFDPLGIFRPELIHHVSNGIEQYLTGKRLSYGGKVRNMVAKHIIEQKEGCESHKMSSGVQMEVYHPWMSRTLTQSIRLQQILDFSKEAPIIIEANFHVAMGMGEWRHDRGQCYVLEVGTIKDRSDFESHKTKKLDTGVGCLRIVSVGGRIWMTETLFDVARPSEPLDNDKLTELLCDKFRVKIYEGD